MLPGTSERIALTKWQRHKSYAENCLLNNGGEEVCESGNAGKKETSSNLEEKRNMIVAWGRIRIENNFLGYKLERE